MKLGAAIGQTRGGWLQGATMGVSPDTKGYRNADTFKLAHGFRADSYTVNATVPLGKSKLMVSWQMARPRQRPDGRRREHAGVQRRLYL